MIRLQPGSAGPLSRRLDAAMVRDDGTAVRVDASPAECDALAAELDLPGIDALGADFRLARQGAEGLRVTGVVTARVRQVCVVSLEEFTSEIVEPVDLRFAPQAEVEVLAAAHAAREDEDAEDLPDPIVNGRIDLGALAAEMLVLGLHPHPRKPEVSFVEPAPPVPEDRVSPFAALHGLKRQGGA